LLPFEVEWEFFQLSDIRDIIVTIFLFVVICYGLIRQSKDDTWTERKFASFFTKFVLGWLSLMIIIPFSILSVSHPSLVLEIGGYILYETRLAMILVLAVIIIIQVLNYRGYFRKKD
jgi:uncharacterized membrane protein YfcA